MMANPKPPAGLKSQFFYTQTTIDPQTPNPKVRMAFDHQYAVIGYRTVDPTKPMDDEVILANPWGNPEYTVRVKLTDVQKYFALLFITD